jgi:hypothetical protein
MRVSGSQAGPSRRDPGLTATQPGGGDAGSRMYLEQKDRLVRKGNCVCTPAVASGGVQSPSGAPQDGARSEKEEVDVQERIL